MGAAVFLVVLSNQLPMTNTVQANQVCFSVEAAGMTVFLGRHQLTDISPCDIASHIPSLYPLGHNYKLKQQSRVNVYVKSAGYFPA
mmetsp:Transcript_4904/g.8531  ORF Transcript_4904/g.8531 Transcript_4904/m.8531 type:complete len:86 (-) Transcript_4904:771-1028(-)